MGDWPQLEPESPFALLTNDETRLWYAYMKVHLRIRYEMNRQLRVDSGISLADYDILVALTSEHGGSMRVRDLAIRIGWERSRLSHHLRGLRNRAMVSTSAGQDDRRVTEVALTDLGRQVLRDAAPGHIALVRAAFLDALTPDEMNDMTVNLDRIYDLLIARGTLPRPNDHP